MSIVTFYPFEAKSQQACLYKWKSKLHTRGNPPTSKSKLNRFNITMIIKNIIIIITIIILIMTIIITIILI